MFLVKLVLELVLDNAKQTLALLKLKLCLIFRQERTFLRRQWPRPCEAWPWPCFASYARVGRALLATLGLAVLHASLATLGLGPKGVALRANPSHGPKGQPKPRPKAQAKA